MIILLMSVQIWSLKTQIGKVIVQDRHPCSSTSFLPFSRFSGKYITEEQTKYVYDKVELGDEIKARKVSQGIQNKALLHKQLKEKEEINLYEKVLVSHVNMIDKNKSHMEQWSILSDNIVYIRSVSYDKMNEVDYRDIKMVDY